MRMLNSGKKGARADILDYREDMGLIVIKYRCPYCRSSHSIIEKALPPYYKTCGKCKGRIVIDKPEE